MTETTRSRRLSRIIAKVVLGAALVLLVVIMASSAVEIDILQISSLLGSKYTNDDYMEDLDEVLDEWDDAIDVAQSTSRISLAPQIDRLQKIRRRAEELELPAAALPAHGDLVDHMTATINGFLALLGQKDEEEVDSWFDRAKLHRTAWWTKVSRLYD